MKPGAETEKGMKWKRKGEDILKIYEEKREAKLEREMLLKLPCLGNKEKKSLYNSQKWLADHFLGSQYSRMTT